MTLLGDFFSFLYHSLCLLRSSFVSARGLTARQLSDEEISSLTDEVI